MNQELTKEIAQKLLEIKGEIRGVDLKTDAEFVIKEKGKEGLKKVEEELKELGYPIEYGKIETMNFYPGGLKALSLLAIKKTLNFSDEKIMEMGVIAPKISIIIKLFIKHFFPIRKFFFQESPKIWKEHWTTGEFIPVELDEEKKFAVARVKDFNLHPVYCTYLRGYFSTFTQITVGGREIICQETKCPFRGDEYHEYLIKWK